MIDIKAIKAAAEAATPQPWIEPGEGNMPFICMLTPATVIALCDEIERLKDCLKKANDQAEHFEREWYLRGDEVERLRKEAARYAWLRNTDHWPAVFPDYDEPEPLRGAELDAAIDAAIEAKQ